MRGPALPCAALCSALAGPALGCQAAEPSDPLDPDRLQELGMEQGSASGSARSGGWTFVFTPSSCDCPTVEVEQASVELCELASLRPIDADLIELDGLLIVELPAAMLSALTGPIDADGGFSVAGRHDASSVTGPLELLGRIDGRFEADDARAAGDAAQRLLGELAGVSVDCRWMGEFSAERQ